MDIEAFYNRKIKDNRIREKVDYILDVKSPSNAEDCALVERALPGDEQFVVNGYYRTMLARYFFALEYTKNKAVLDTCSGMGWGSYLITENAKAVLGFDRDDNTIEFCRRVWKAENLRWEKLDALNLTNLNLSFDVVLAMETIEHFDEAEAVKYINGIDKVLNKDGILIGSSAFPETTEQAQKILESGSRHHKHIFTKSEINRLLLPYFQDVKIIDSWLFIAQRKGGRLRSIKSGVSRWLR